MGFLSLLFGGNKEASEEKRLEDEAKSFDRLKYDGVKAVRTGQYVIAIKCLKAALEINDDLETRDYLAQALVRNGELLPAYEQLQKLAEAQPDNQAIFEQMANVAYMMEDYVAMSHACEKAILIDNTNPRVHYLYAKACIGQEDMINAIAMLTKAIALKPDFADAYLLRGQTLLGMGDRKGAREDMEHLLADYPEQEDVLMLKARIERAEGKADEAIVTYTKVTDVNPFAIEAFKERGQVKYDKGDMAGAKEDLQKVLEIDPDRAADISGEYSAEGIEHKVRKAYSNINPLGL